MLRFFALVVGVTLVASPAWAERSEVLVGINGGTMLPGFSAPTPTAFALATWLVGVEGQYGITDNIYLRASFSFSSFAGTADAEGVGSDARTYSGPMAFNGVYYHPELGARFKVLGGYHLAPYVEASVGYLWGAFTDLGIRTKAGGTLALSDRAQGVPTVGVGVALDYRLFDLMFAGVAVRYVRALGEGFATHYFSVPLTVSFYW